MGAPTAVRRGTAVLRLDQMMPKKVLVQPPGRIVWPARFGEDEFWRTLSPVALRSRRCELKQMM